MDTKEELKEIMNKQIIISKNIDKALEFHTKLNPIDLYSQVDSEEFRDQQSKIQAMVITWIDMFDEMLEVGSDLPVALLARASEIARSMTKEDRDDKETTHEG